MENEKFKTQHDMESLEDRLEKKSDRVAELENRFGKADEFFSSTEWNLLEVFKRLRPIRREHVGTRINVVGI